MARSTSVKISSEPYDLDRPSAVSGVLPQGAGSGKRSLATLSETRTASRPESSRSARLAMFCAATVLVALARILSACELSAAAFFSAFCALALAALLVGLALLLVELPAHVVDVDLGAVGVQVEDLVDDRLDQVDVVGDHDEAAAVGLEVVAQPDDRVGVEVVGRLVEEQGVGVREQDPGELDAAALTAGERVQRLAEHPVGQAERGGDGGGLGLGGVPALGEELRLQALVLLHRLLAGGALAVGDALLVLAHLADQDVEAAGGEDAVAGEDVEVAGARVLREVADLAGAGDGAAGGDALAREALGEGGLARAVAADQADAVALGDTEGGGLDEDAGAGAQLDAGGGDHGKTPGRDGRRRDGRLRTSTPSNAQGEWPCGPV